MSRKQVNKLPLEERVLSFIKEHRLTPSRKTVLVAVSGGQDSVCLLFVLNNLKTTLGIKLHVAHLDHQLRGKESTGDARYVAGLAKRLGIPSTIEKRDVLQYQRENGVSLEEAAREVRYNFLAKVADKIGADRVAVGHTLDDNAETILLHLVRGSGTRGLRGLQPVTKWQTAARKLTVIRPLLEVRRDETAAYCASHQLQPRLDATNLSLQPLRNRVRLELLLLLKSYNPQVIESILRTAHIAGDDIAFLEKEARRLWRKVAGQRGQTIVLDKEAILKQSPSMQRHLLRLAIEKMVGNLKDIEARHIEELMQALNKPAGKQISLPYGLVFTIDYTCYLLGRESSRRSPFPVLDGEIEIKIPGKTVIPGWRIQASIIKKSNSTRTDDKFMAYFDYDLVGDKLTLRSRKRGDRFQPLGMTETKKISQFMMDSRIPRDWRTGIPIICNGDKVLWVVGYRIDERVKVTEKTKRVLRLKLEEE
jgi:tRNA(Ile)-lysidine synthase